MNKKQASFYIKSSRAIQPVQLASTLKSTSKQTEILTTNSTDICYRENLRQLRHSIVIRPSLTFHRIHLQGRNSIKAQPKKVIYKLHYIITNTIFNVEISFVKRCARQLC